VILSTTLLHFYQQGSGTSGGGSGPNGTFELSLGMLGVFGCWTALFLAGHWQYQWHTRILNTLAADQIQSQLQPQACQHSQGNLDDLDDLDDCEVGGLQVGVGGGFAQGASTCIKPSSVTRCWSTS
jgi:hypothetical protein